MTVLIPMDRRLKRSALCSSDRPSRLAGGTLALFAALFLGWMAAPVWAQGQKAVGEVSFVSGTAVVTNRGQTPISVGSKVFAGDRLQTAAQSHVHVRFMDNAFVSLRPETELHIEQYEFDAAHPERSRVKFSLNKGTSRLITGRGGQSAKENFRVNTPVSAIGIRGTDFVVQTSHEATRVAVHQGAIVAAPLDAVCTAQTLGPCAGPSARELAGSLSFQYLEIRGSSPAELIAPKNGAAGRIFTPASPAEPAIGKPVSSGTPTGASAVADRALEQKFVAGYSASDSFVWGRWAGGSVPQDYELVGRAGDLALLKVQGESDYSESKGVVAFELQKASAFAVQKDGQRADATVTNPELRVNFNSMRYATQFDFSANQQTETLKSKGVIEATGAMRPKQGNIELYGSLDQLGQEAAFVFITKNQPGLADRYGILQWKR
jgi:ferric-dicitrate binding protein FerR (iron transport regulator)